MDRGKNKVRDGAPDAPPARRRRGGSWRRKYPPLSEQRTFLYEFPVPNRQPQAIRISANFALSSSESDEESLEDSEPSSEPPAVAQGPQNFRPNRAGPSTWQTDVPGTGPTTGLRLGTGGPRSIDPKIGRAACAVHPDVPSSRRPTRGNPRSIDPNIGQAVFGLIQRRCSGGYLLRVAIGDSADTHPGVMFMPEGYNPFQQDETAVPDEAPVPNQPNPMNAAATGAESGFPMIAGAINWTALKVGGPPGVKDKESEEALREAAHWSLKVPRNITEEMLSEVKEIVRTKSNWQGPLRSAPQHNPEAHAYRHEHQDLQKTIEEALAVGVAALMEPTVEGEGEEDAGSSNS